MLVANYGGGSVCMLPIQDDGTLGEATDFIQHEGASVDPARQQGPHAHSIVIDPTNQYAFTPDLGLDKILIYKIDLTNGKLIPNDPPWAEVAPGGGPRHFDFHPSRKYAYVINEMGNTVTAFTYDETNGSLAEIQRFQRCLTVLMARVTPPMSMSPHRGSSSTALIEVMTASSFSQ